MITTSTTVEASMAGGLVVGEGGYDEIPTMNTENNDLKALR